MQVTSDHHIVIERMIRAGEVAMSELERLPATLEADELITKVEREALLKLARESKSGSTRAGIIALLLKERLSPVDGFDRLQQRSRHSIF